MKTNQLVEEWMKELYPEKEDGSGYDEPSEEEVRQALTVIALSAKKEVVEEVWEEATRTAESIDSDSDVLLLTELRKILETLQSLSK